MNQSLSSEWGAGGVELSLSTFDVQHLTLGTWKDAHTLLVTSWRSSWLGTSLSSHHQAGISSCLTHHLIHLAPSIREGSEIEVGGRPPPNPAPARGISPPRNSWMWGSREGGHSRSLSLALDQLDWPAGLPSHLQVSRWGSFTSVSLLELLLDDDGVKVTHHLNQEGLGDWSHLLAGSPWCDATWGDLGLTIHNLGSPSMAAWVSPASRASVTVPERAAHSLNFILQQCHSSQCPSVGFSCYGQSFLTGVSLHIPEPVGNGMGSWPGIQLGGQAWGHHLGSPLVPPLAVWKHAYAGSILW